MEKSQSKSGLSPSHVVVVDPQPPISLESRAAALSSEKRMGGSPGGGKGEAIGWLRGRGVEPVRHPKGPEATPAAAPRVVNVHSELSLRPCEL